MYDITFSDGTTFTGELPEFIHNVSEIESISFTEEGVKTECDIVSGDDIVSIYADSNLLEYERVSDWK